MALAPIEIPEEERKMIALWKFDEAEGGEAADSSDNNIVGTLIGNPQWQPTGGKVGGALEFDGVDDYIDFGSNVNLNTANAVTIAAWIKLSGPAEDQKIISNQDNIVGGYKFGVYSNKIEFEIRDSGNTANINRYVEGGMILQPDVWYHVMGIYSQGNYIRTYVNGNLDRELSTVGVLAPTSGTIKIGREPFLNAYFFKGLIDELSIYNYALSDADIAAVYSGKALTLAQAETPAASEKKAAGSFIPVLVIVIIAVVVVGLAIRIKKAKT